MWLGGAEDEDYPRRQADYPEDGDLLSFFEQIYNLFGVMGGKEFINHGMNACRTRNVSLMKGKYP